MSGMVHAGIRSVAVFSKSPYRSLMDHLGSGKEWDLNRKREGLFFLPSSLPHDEHVGLGSFRQFAEHLDYFKEALNNMLLWQIAIRSVTFLSRSAQTTP
ncbi:hypothetical protein PO124_17960 [Bacillus licheniformis]|nr:hypothetical protein [Bacillus licheniformis]